MSTRARSLNSRTPVGVPGAGANHWSAPEFASQALPTTTVESTVACCLERELLAAFLSRVPGAQTVRAERLHELARGDLIHLVVADPAGSNGRCTDELLRLRATWPLITIVLYTHLRAALMPSIVRLAQSGVQDVVIYGTDDSKSRFEELIERSAAVPLTSATLRLLGSKLDRLPSALAAAIREMFDSPRKLAGVHQLAAAAGTTRRSLYRHCSAAGFRSPRLLVASARILRAAHVLAHSDMSVRDVAFSLGFSKPDIMTLQVVSLTGLRPRQLRNSSVLADLPEIIAERLGSSPGLG